MQCENDLATWVLEQREKVVCLDQYEIQKKALHFYDLIHPNIDSVISIVITQPPASYLDVSPASNQVESPALHVQIMLIHYWPHQKKQ